MHSNLHKMQNFILYLIYSLHKYTLGIEIIFVETRICGNFACPYQCMIEIDLKGHL